MQKIQGVIVALQIESNGWRKPAVGLKPRRDSNTLYWVK